MRRRRSVQTTPKAAIIEREVALLLVKVAAWVSPACTDPSRHDLVYALNRVFAVVSRVVRSAGGEHGSADNEVAMALRDLAAVRSTRVAVSEAMAGALGSRPPKALIWEAVPRPHASAPMRAALLATIEQGDG